MYLFRFIFISPTILICCYTLECWLFLMLFDVDRRTTYFMILPYSSRHGQISKEVWWPFNVTKSYFRWILYDHVQSCECVRVPASFLRTFLFVFRSTNCLEWCSNLLFIVQFIWTFWLTAHRALERCRVRGSFDSLFLSQCLINLSNIEKQQTF